jgi:hypothetical protein
MGLLLRLLALPPYSPELNPVERIWHYLRSHWLANSVFTSLADIMDVCEMAWNRFATDHGLSISARAFEEARRLISDYFVPMAERTYGDASATQADRNAATLARWILRFIKVSALIR